ncbi:uncharacterized protein LOC143245035 [Tachypleus tridentatus]|uniref:uncharacterized protein LOC143245035 n=1 Tax=Tachypleus tridentatus TaxID=6853 RepID=UPI003FD1A6D6
MRTINNTVLRQSSDSVGQCLVESSNMRRKNVRRRLFERVDHDETQHILQQELAILYTNDSQRWNFDFQKEKPLEGPWKWMEVKPNDPEIPQVYGRMVNIGCCGNSSDYESNFKTGEMSTKGFNVFQNPAKSTNTKELRKHIFSRKKNKVTSTARNFVMRGKRSKLRQTSVSEILCVRKSGRKLKTTSARQAKKSSCFSSTREIEKNSRSSSTRQTKKSLKISSARQTGKGLKTTSTRQTERGLKTTFTKQKEKDLKTTFTKQKEKDLKTTSTRQKEKGLKTTSTRQTEKGFKTASTRQTKRKLKSTSNRQTEKRFKPVLTRRTERTCSSRSYTQLI